MNEAHAFQKSVSQKKDKKVSDNDQHGERLMETGTGSVGAQGKKAAETLEEPSEFTCGLDPSRH